MVNFFQKYLVTDAVAPPDLEAFCSWILIERPWGFSGVLSAEMVQVSWKQQGLKLEELKIKLGGAAPPRIKWTNSLYVTNCIQRNLCIAYQ